MIKFTVFLQISTRRNLKDTKINFNKTLCTFCRKAGEFFESDVQKSFLIQIEQDFKGGDVV